MNDHKFIIVGQQYILPKMSTNTSTKTKITIPSVKTTIRDPKTEVQVNRAIRENNGEEFISFTARVSDLGAFLSLPQIQHGSKIPMPNKPDLYLVTGKIKAKDASEFDSLEYVKRFTVASSLGPCNK